jgi:prepilin-type N-terminal cleavage/methylation domain-containing protein
MRTRCGRRGFTLVELAVVMAVAALALSTMTNTFVSIGRLGPANRETGAALDAARSTLEVLRATPFDEIYARYNEDPADDPGGAGSAPGNRFAVPFLSARPDDADGMVGEIEFPTLGAELREDVDDRPLGLPRDLDLDGAIDGVDHAGDYRVLPVRIQVEWRSRSGDRHVNFYSTITEP